MSSFAEQKKLILPYLQRADEVQALDPKVAYYCRLYAINQGIQIQDKHPEIDGVLEALMSKLEQDNKKLTLSETDRDHCEAFAVNVFNRADKQDRSGKADHNTVRAFYVATVFIQILEQFGKLPPDMVERQQYAGWKAADIRKALREGRTPTPGPAVKDSLDLDLPDIPGGSSTNVQATNASQDLDLPTPPTAPSGPPAARDLAPVTGPNASRGPGAHPPPSDFQHQPRIPQVSGQKFLPGNTVYYNAYDGSLLKGTVINLLEGTPGPSYQVALSAKVIDIREERLAHDFSPGARVLLTQQNGSVAEGSVSKVDASRWPVAYLLTMTDGSMLPAVAASLAPLLAPRGARGEEDAAETSQSQPPDKVRSSDRQPDTAHTDNSPQSPPDVNVRSNAGAADRDPANPAYPDIDIQSDSGSVAQYHGERDQSFPNIDHHPGPFETAPRAGGRAANAMDDTARSQDLGSEDGAKLPGPSTQPGSSVAGHGDGTGALSTPGPGNQPAGNADPQSSSIPPGVGSSRSGAANFSEPPKRADGLAPGLPDPLRGQGAPAGIPGPQGAGPSGAGPAQFISQHTLPAVSGPTHPPQPLAQGRGPYQTAERLQGAQSSYQPSIHVINDAHKVTKTALSALSFEDVPTALKYLNKAIELLTVPGAQK